MKQLLAPNGKPSNLTPEQWKLVRTPQFKAWFGDWENNPENASKVVDENGEPLVVYHGTSYDFNVFKIGRMGGLFFTDNLSYAERFASGDMKRQGEKSKMLKCFLNARKCYDKNTHDETLIDDYYNKFVEEGATKLKKKERLKYVKSLEDKYKDFFINLAGFSMLDSNRKNHLLLHNYDCIITDGYSDTKFYVVFESNQIKLADGTNTTFDGSNPDIRFEEGGKTKRTMKRIKRGGITYGKSHAEGGIPVKNQSTGDMLEVEGGEGIVNKRSMASDKKVKLNGKEMTICEAVSQLNQLEGGVQFSCDDVSDRQFIEAMAKGGELERGTRTEKEHIQVLKDLYAKRITPKEASKRIAKDHLKEDTHYYSKLAKMEGKMAQGGEIFDKETEDYLSKLTNKFAKGGQIYEKKKIRVYIDSFTDSTWFNASYGTFRDGYNYAEVLVTIVSKDYGFAKMKGKYAVIETELEEISGSWRNKNIFDTKEEAIEFIEKRKSDESEEYAKGGEVVADKTETINMKDFEGYADQYNGRKNKFFKATDEYQLLVNEGMDVKNNKDLPQEEKDKLLAELRDKAREAKSKLSEERKDFVSLREVKSPFYAPQLAKGGMTAKQRIDKGEGGSYKLKTKHQFFPAKGIDVYLHIDSQSMRGTMQFTLGMRNLDVQNPKQVISDVLEKKRLSPSSYQVDVTKEAKSIKVKIIFNFIITSDNFTYLSKEILKALTNKEYYQSILDEKKEETPPPTSTPPPTQRKGLPSTDLRVWGAEYEIGDKVKIRWDFSTDLGNGASDVIYDSPENFFEITDKTILSEAKRKENPTGFLYELTNGQSWEGKDLEIIEEQAIPPTEKEDDWNWRFKTSEELRAELGGDLHAMKDGSVFTRSMSYLLGKKIKETTDSLDAIFRINRNTYGGVEVNTEKAFGISNPENNNEWYISSWMITDKIIEDEVHKYVFDWSKKLFDEMPKKDKFDGAHYLPFSNLVNQILKNDGGLSYSDFESFISLCELSNKIERDVVSVVDDTESSEFVKNLLITKYSELLQKVRAKIFEFTNESDFQIDTQVEKVYLYIPYLAKLNTFDKKYIINIK